jgi:hypothetical protein
MNKLSLGLLILLSSMMFLSCKKDDTIVAAPGNSSITGTLKFLDESPASFAKIELKSNASGRSIYDTCDVNGSYTFAPLRSGDYTIIFRSTSYDISTSYVAANLLENQNLSQDVFIRYNMLDDFATKIINQDVFFIRMHPDGAKIGGNYSVIKNLSGYYNANGIDSVTLSADVYLVPDNINWANPGVDLTSDYIKTNFQFLFSVDEEPRTNSRHQINLFNNAAEEMFSNPSNGFAFVRRDSLAKEIKIPCVDFSNNDFGLKIFYN